MLHTAVTVLGTVIMVNSGPSGHHPECLQQGEDVRCDHVTESLCNVCDNSGRASAVPALHQSAVSAFSARTHRRRCSQYYPLLCMITTLALSDNGDTGVRTGGSDHAQIFAINRYTYRLC